MCRTCAICQLYEIDKGIHRRVKKITEENENEDKKETKIRYAKLNYSHCDKRVLFEQAMFGDVGREMKTPAMTMARASQRVVTSNKSSPGNRDSFFLVHNGRNVLKSQNQVRYKQQQ